MFLTGKKDTDNKILLNLDIHDIINICKTNKYARKLCNNPELWWKKTLLDFGLNLNNVGHPLDKYRALYIKLYKFNKTLQVAKNRFSQTLKETEDNFLVDKVYKVELYKLAKYILENGPKDEKLCKAVTLKFGPEIVKLKPNYPIKLGILGKDDELRLVSYCQQLASISALQIVFEEKFEYKLELPLDLAVKTVRLDLIYFLLKYKESDYVIESMYTTWNFDTYKYAIKNLRKYGLDLIEYFNKHSDKYVTFVKIMEEGNIKAIDYFIDHGYILTEQDKNYMDKLQRTDPNDYGYGNIFEKYLL